MTAQLDQPVDHCGVPSPAPYPVDPQADSWMGLDDELLELLAEPGMSEEDVFHALVPEIVASWSLYDQYLWSQLVIFGQCLELPTVEEGWHGVSRLAPRPLGGVTGVCGPVLAGRLANLDPQVLSPAQPNPAIRHVDNDTPPPFCPQERQASGCVRLEPLIGER